MRPLISRLHTRSNFGLVKETMDYRQPAEDGVVKRYPITDALGFGNANQAMATHCKGVRKSHPLQTAGGLQKLRIINEPDMMRLPQILQFG